MFYLANRTFHFTFKMNKIALGISKEFITEDIFLHSSSSKNPGSDPGRMCFQSGYYSAFLCNDHRQ